jgi:hypothetical protein
MSDLITRLRALADAYGRSIAESDHAESRDRWADYRQTVVAAADALAAVESLTRRGGDGRILSATLERVLPRSFATLRAGMSPESQQEAAQRTADMLAELEAAPAPVASPAPIWRIEIRAEYGSYTADCTSGDGRTGMAGVGNTPVGALADLCKTLICVDEDEAIERRQPPLTSPPAPTEGRNGGGTDSMEETRPETGGAPCHDR